MDKLQKYSAIIFQFSLLVILVWILREGIGDPEVIIGAFIGLLVGINIDGIK